MGSIEKLASKFANGDADSVRVWRRPDGEVVVAEDGYETGNGDMWSGSIGAWQAALLTALSAKFVEGTLIIETPKLVSHGAMMEAHEVARKVEDATKRTVVILGPGWRNMSIDEAEQALRALLSAEHYPQLTDWVQAQPSGTFLLTVFSKKQTELQRFDLRDAPRKIVLSIRETELSTASFGSGVDYYAVWLSRHVSPECESKIPRGVKVYRER